MSIPPIGSNGFSQDPHDSENPQNPQDFSQSNLNSSENIKDTPSPSPSAQSINSNNQHTQIPQNSTQNTYGQYGQYGQANPNVQDFTAGYHTVIPMRPLSIGDTVDAVIRLLKFNPIAFIIFPLLVAVVFHAINFLCTKITGESTLFSAIQLLDSLSGQNPNPFASPTHIATFSIGAFFISTIFALIIFIIQNAIVTIAATRTTIASVRGYKLALRDTWHLIQPRFWSLLGRIIGLSILIAIIFATLLLALFIPLILAFIGFANATSGSDEATVFMIVFTVLFLFVSIIACLTLYVRISIAQSAMVAEDCGPINAIRRAWILTRGSFWHIFVLMIFTTILTLLVTFVISTFFAFLAFIVFGIIPDDGTFFSFLGRIQIINILDTLFTQICIYPIFAALTNLIYVNMRFKRENFHQQLLYEASQKMTQNPHSFGTQDQTPPQYR